MGYSKINMRDKTKAAVVKMGASIFLLVQTLQVKWSGWMQRQTEKLSTRGKRWMLAVFSLFFCSLSAVKLTKSFIEKPAPVLKISKISTTTAVQDSKTNISKSGKEMERIQRFSQWMDSLSTDPIGKYTYDSICRARPGLLDSINMVKELIQETSKN